MNAKPWILSLALALAGAATSVAQNENKQPALIKIQKIVAGKRMWIKQLDPPWSEMCLVS
jgi:hypothetical protein